MTLGSLCFGIFAIYWVNEMTFSNNLSFLLTVRGNCTLRRLHVQYFGDNGSRSWVHSSCLIRFEGLEAFNKLAAKIQSEVSSY
jgi:hypothetical protein